MTRPQAIPHPGTSLVSLQQSVLALKEHVETLENARGAQLEDKAVTLGDLLTLGLIGESDLALFRSKNRP